MENISIQEGTDWVQLLLINFAINVTIYQPGGSLTSTTSYQDHQHEYKKYSLPFNDSVPSSLFLPPVTRS